MVQKDQLDWLLLDTRVRNVTKKNYREAAN